MVSSGKPVLVQIGEKLDELLLDMLKRGYKEVIRNGKKVRTPLKAADLEVCRKRLVMCGVSSSDRPRTVMEQIVQNMQNSGMRFPADDSSPNDDLDRIDGDRSYRRG